MRPEQAGLGSLDVDTRTDIYALGVLLYELLTGTTPVQRESLHQAALDEVRRLIREIEPPKPSTRLNALGEKVTEVATHRQTEPSTLRKLVRGDLDWIMMKALEKDRRRRYDRAADFARDVQRHLDDAAVEAYPPSAVYRLRKFAKRNKGPVVAVSLVLLTLLGGIAGTSWGLVL